MEKFISKNKKIEYQYEIRDTFLAGMILYGDEVKSIKNNRVDYADSYVKIDGTDTAILYNFNIALYQKSNLNNIKHKLNRTIKLLLTKKEIIELKSYSQQKTFSIIPNKIYLKGGLIKIEICVARGKKKFDKRDDIKNKDLKRKMQRDYKLNV
ncbi:MAG: SsrA-binding protein SmpB [Patescibacteria group bacterium]|nr:SsrA-binding protein SmpB [Patescibacteria group bacterium]MDD4304568.1 SsrA-binding protein SmpB [Patescibacteria group bacterium]MDD4695755.1 SsrA-binding protein SmpB [Patescibacteria group bacterium]